MHRINLEIAFALASELVAVAVAVASCSFDFSKNSLLKSSLNPHECAFKKFHFNYCPHLAIKHILETIFPVL